MFINFLRIFILTGAFLLPILAPVSVKGAVAPVGQLPSVTVSVTPSVYAVPILLVEDLGEWKDFGIQISLKIYANGEEQLDRIVGNEWEVAVMDPFYAVKGGNEGNVAIVGLAGNFASQIHFLLGKGVSPPPSQDFADGMKGKRAICPTPSAEHFWLTALLKRQGVSRISSVISAKNDRSQVGVLLSGKGDLLVLRSPQAYLLVQQGFPLWAEGRGKKIFLPAPLVATATYADTRKTLVIRWLEGYGRGIRIIQKDPAKAASRLRALYKKAMNLDVSEKILQREIGEAFYFDEKEREGPFQSKEGKPSGITEFANSMTQYQYGMKALESKADPSEYILARICDQLIALRGEAMSQLVKTRAAIEEAAKAGAQVKKFQKAWEEARMQIQDERGCLTVIGILSDLQRSADQARVASGRLRDFRRIEMAIGFLLILYYMGYAIHRKKKSRVHST